MPGSSSSEDPVIFINLDVINCLAGYIRQMKVNLSPAKINLISGFGSQHFIGVYSKAIPPLLMSLTQPNLKPIPFSP